MKKRQPTASERRRVLVKPNTIVNIGLKKDLEEILKNPNNLLKYYKSNRVTNNSIEIWYKEPASFSSNVYYEDYELMNSDFEIFDKIIKDGKTNNEI